MTDRIGENKIRRRRNTPKDLGEVANRMREDGSLWTMLEMMHLLATTGKLFTYARNKVSKEWERTTEFIDQRHETKIRLDAAQMVRKAVFGDDVKRSESLNVTMSMGEMLDRKLERLNDHEKWANSILMEPGVVAAQAGGDGPAALPEPLVHMSDNGHGDPEGVEGEPPLESGDHREMPEGP